MHNATLFTADRNTHWRIVVAALIASTAVGLMAIGARGIPASSGSHFTTDARQTVVGI
jgi:hypothetical protein